MLWPLRSIFATKPASFRATCTLDDAVDRLSAATRRSAWIAWLEASPECLMGRVSRDAVIVWWYRGPRTPLPAVFRGTFSVAQDAVILTGQFQHRTTDRLFLTAMVVILLLFLMASVTGLAVVFGLTLPLGDRLIAAGFLWALMATTAIAVFCSVQPLRQDDIRKVSMAVLQALDDPPNSTLQRPGARDVCPGC